MLWRLVIKIFFFSLPVLPLLPLPIWILWKSNELQAVRISTLAKEAQPASSETLYGPAYSNCSLQYKYEMAKARGAEVLALGTSRVEGFRSLLFISETSFYNATGGISNVFHIRPFLSRLPKEKQPKVLLLGLDQNFFNAKWPRINTNYESDRKEQTCSDPLHFASRSWQRVLLDLLIEKKYSLKQLFIPLSYRPTGLNAQVNTNGFRKDGSYLHGTHARELASIDLRFEDYLQSIAVGGYKFEHSSEVDESVIVEIRSVLDYCKRENIHVAAFIPPYANPVYNRMVASGKYGYLQKMRERLDKEFEASGFSLFDATNATSFGTTDEEFTDGHHGTEKAYLKLLVQMVKQDPVLATYSDLRHLKQLLSETQGHLFLRDSFF